VLNKLTAGIGSFLLGLLLFGTASTYASHPWPDPTYGYINTLDSMYPQANGQVSFRALTNTGQPVPTSDGLVLLDAIDNKWEPILDYILVLGGDRQFNYYGVAYNDSTAKVSYLRQSTQAQINTLCGGTNYSSCQIPLNFVWNATYSRWVMSKSNIPYGPLAYDYGDAIKKKVFSHEWGHMLGLSHHSPYPNCQTVMSPGHCTNLPAAPDGGTAIATVYAY